MCLHHPLRLSEEIQGLAPSYFHGTTCQFFFLFCRCEEDRGCIPTHGHPDPVPRFPIGFRLPRLSPPTLLDISDFAKTFDLPLTPHVNYFVKYCILLLRCQEFPRHCFFISRHRAVSFLLKMISVSNFAVLGQKSHAPDQFWGPSRQWIFFF